MKLLVTGAAGFIGSTYVRLARRATTRSSVLDKLTYAGRRENLPDGGRSSSSSGGIEDRGARAWS